MAAATVNLAAVADHRHSLTLPRSAGIYASQLSRMFPMLLSYYEDRPGSYINAQGARMTGSSLVLKNGSSREYVMVEPKDLHLPDSIPYWEYNSFKELFPDIGKYYIRGIRPGTTFYEDHYTKVNAAVVGGSGLVSQAAAPAAAVVGGSGLVSQAATPAAAVAGGSGLVSQAAAPAAAVADNVVGIVNPNGSLALGIPSSLSNKYNRKHSRKHRTTRRRNRSRTRRTH